MIVGFQSVPIRLSAIVRQRIGIDRRLVISIVKYLVAIIRLRRYFSIAGGTLKKKVSMVSLSISIHLFFRLFAYIFVIYEGNCY